ncbi:MAG: hypothetical protein KA316_14465, partial [Rhodoferax sp.]|nr:hypothetical protein [Rhodoferax sp.]
VPAAYENFEPGHVVCGHGFSDLRWVAVQDGRVIMTGTTMEDHRIRQTGTACLPWLAGCRK